MTPGQAAYAAYYAAVATLPGILLPPWDELIDAEHRAWESAAKGAAPGYAMLVDDQRELLAEMLSSFVTFGRHEQFRRCVLGEEEFNRWLERSGLHRDALADAARKLAGEPDVHR